MFKKNKKKLKKNDFIQDASLENKEKKVDFELKKIQLTEKKEFVKNWEKRRLIDLEEKTKIEKINSLRWLLESITVDEENTIIVSEPKLKSVFSEEEHYKIKEKIFKIIESL
jgi:hypothetical protein